MVLDAVSNFVRGNTDAAVDATQTTISVVDASIFPDPATDGEYNVVIWDVEQFPRPDEDPNVEVMRVTAIDTGTNDLTVVRAQEGTAGASHPSGAAVHLSPTAKMFSDIESTFGDFWDATAQELTADVNNGAVTTGQALIGPVTGAVSTVTFERPELNKSETTIQVPQDEDTPQDALRKVPYRLAANYWIEIDETGDYSAEDWVIPPVVSLDIYDATEGGNSRLTVTRQGSSGQLNPNSVYGIGGTGQGNVVLQHVYPTGVNPYDDEDAAFAFYGGGQFKINRCGVGGGARPDGSTAISSYASKLKVETSFDWGTDLFDVGGETKQGGIITFAPTETANGSVRDHAWQATSGIIQHGRNGPTAGGAFAADPRRGGGIVTDIVPMVTEDGGLIDFANAQNDELWLRDKNNNTRVRLLDGGGFVFQDANGNNTARLDSSGNLTIAGGLTEDGAP